MHNYYKSIGFSEEYSKNVIRNIIKKAVDDYKKNELENSFGRLIEIFVLFDKSIGLAIHGEFINEDEFEVEYAFPFIRPKQYFHYDDIVIERNTASYSFSAGCDIKESGLTVIFYLQNALDYVNKKLPEKVSTKVGMSALSLSGKIILPTKEYDEYKEAYNKIKKEKSDMLKEAQQGDEDAIENLTFDEMNTYTKISKRLESEDVYSIVDTSLMPFGMECDKYAVIGKIKQIEICVNRITSEKIYNLTLECNDVIINVGINEIDLIGEPKVGRRFKGNIWLQGNILF